MVFDSNGAGGRRRPPADVAPVNPRMALLPTARALGGDDGEIIHGSWDLLSIGKGASDPAPWNVGRRLRCRVLRTRIPADTFCAARTALTASSSCLTTASER